MFRIKNDEDDLVNDDLLIVVVNDDDNDDENDNESTITNETLMDRNNNKRIDILFLIMHFNITVVVLVLDLLFMPLVIYSFIYFTFFIYFLMGEIILLFFFNLSYCEL